MKCTHTQCNRHECVHTKPLRKLVLPNRHNSCWVPYLGAMPPLYCGHEIVFRWKAHHSIAPAARYNMTCTYGINGQRGFS